MSSRRHSLVYTFSIIDKQRYRYSAEYVFREMKILMMNQSTLSLGFYGYPQLSQIRNAISTYMSSTFPNNDKYAILNDTKINLH